MERGLAFIFLVTEYKKDALQREPQGARELVRKRKEV